MDFVEGVVVLGPMFWSELWNAYSLWNEKFAAYHVFD